MEEHLDQPEHKHPEYVDQWENLNSEYETELIEDLEDKRKQEQKRKQSDWEPYILKNKSLGKVKGPMDTRGNLKKKDQRTRWRNLKKIIGEDKRGKPRIWR